MIEPLPTPDELWAKVPPDAQAAIAAAFLAMRQRVEELETRVGDLEARLKLNSTNSSRPPSSDPIGRTAPRPYRLYVPNNSADLVVEAWADGNVEATIATRRTGKDVRPTRLVGGDAFTGGNTERFLWRLPSSPSESMSEYIATLSVAARSLTHLGWGVDMAAGHGSVVGQNEVTEIVSDRRLDRWTPDHSGTPLRVPQRETVQGPSTLHALASRHGRFIQRMRGGRPQDVPPLTAFRVVGYRRATDPPQKPFAAFGLLKPDATYASDFRPFDPARHGAAVAGMIRHAAASQELEPAMGWTRERIAGFVLGHGESLGQPYAPVQGPRLAFLPLPSIENRGDRGMAVTGVRRALITVLNGDDGGDLKRLARLVSGGDLIEEGAGDAVARLAPILYSDSTVTLYTKPSTTWATVTPVILPGYDDPRKVRKRLFPKSDADAPRLDAAAQADGLAKLDTRIDQLLRKAVRQAGHSDELARFAEIDWRGIGFWPGTEPATRYVPPITLRRFRRLHVRITWRDAGGRPIAVPGPICIGGGRYCGLGLFAATD